MAEADDGFFARWSRRKQALREGRALEDPAGSAVTHPAAGPGPEPRPAQTPSHGGSAGHTPVFATQPPEPPPTLQDVAQLSPQSDFSRFVRPDVDPQVKHAALRKLFADPHFNRMDGLDVYIDDYHTPNPLPAAMLRKMASAHFLGLVQEESKPPAPTVAADAPEPVVTVSAASPANGPSAAEPLLPNEANPDHDHADLRLQPDHAARPHGPERGSQ